jgi:hypothetical protein
LAELNEFRRETQIWFHTTNRAICIYSRKYEWSKQYKQQIAEQMVNVALDIRSDSAMLYKIARTLGLYAAYADDSVESVPVDPRWYGKI